MERLLRKEHEHQPTTATATAKEEKKWTDQSKKHQIGRKQRGESHTGHIISGVLRATLAKMGGTRHTPHAT